MTKKEVISRLCALTTKVGPKLNPLFAHDCFCGENELSETEVYGGFQFNHEVIEFIEGAVEVALINLQQSYSKNRPGHPKF